MRLRERKSAKGNARSLNFISFSRINNGHLECQTLDSTSPFPILFLPSSFDKSGEARLENARERVVKKVVIRFAIFQFSSIQRSGQIAARGGRVEGEGFLAKANISNVIAICLLAKDDWDAVRLLKIFEARGRWDGLATIVGG